MTKKETIEYDTCPRCDSRTAVYHIERSPFPDDEQNEEREICQNCGLNYQRNFTSTNATTMHNWSVKREAINQRVDQAFGKISSYSHPSKEQLKQVVQDLSSDDFPFLYVKLKDHEKSTSAHAVSDTSEIVSKARADEMFLPGGLPSGMVDFYDNEVSAIHHSLTDELSAISQIRELLKEIEQERKF